MAKIKKSELGVFEARGDDYIENVTYSCFYNALSPKEKELEKSSVLSFFRDYSRIRYEREERAKLADESLHKKWRSLGFRSEMYFLIVEYFGDRLEDIGEDFNESDSAMLIAGAPPRYRDYYRSIGCPYFTRILDDYKIIINKRKELKKRFERKFPAEKKAFLESEKHKFLKSVFISKYMLEYAYDNKVIRKSDFVRLSNIFLSNRKPTKSEKELKEFKKTFGPQWIAENLKTQ